MTQIDRDVRPGGRATRHECSRCLEAADALVPGGGSNVLDNDIDAFFVRDFSNFLRDLLLVMVDAIVSTKRPRLFEFRSIPRCCDHTAVKQLRNLNGCDAHAGACTENQNGLPGTNP